MSMEEAKMSDELKIQYEEIGDSGEHRLTVRLPDDSVHVDKVDVTDEDDRKRFVSGLCCRFNALDETVVLEQLERIAADCVTRGTARKRRPQSQADRLVNLTKDCELFHDSDGETYASFNVAGDAGDHRETWLIKSKSFKSWLNGCYYKRYQKSPSSQAVQDAMNTINGKARYGGKVMQVAVRLAESHDGIYLDLADQAWRVVEVTSLGWRVISGSDCPVRFVRRKGMLPLPEPVAGGDLTALRDLLNISSDADWALFVAWLVMTFRPKGPYPILIVNGEQGSAKSTLCRMTRAMSDPNSAPLRRPPRDDRDLLIAAMNGRMLTFDNLSGIKPDLADALCSLATGGGFATRELYSDSEEVLFDAQRPIIVNGIDDLATRPDLLDRAVVLHLSAIPEAQRRPESELVPAFEAARPAVLGRLLDGVVKALRDHASVAGPFPRMADFCQWAIAAETALGLPAGMFLKAYRENRGASVEAAVEASPIGPVILELLTGMHQWRGTATELLNEINNHNQHGNRRDLPVTTRGVGLALKRIAPELRRLGIEVTHERTGRERSRQIMLARKETLPSVASATSATDPDYTQEDQADDADKQMRTFSGARERERGVI
jgi:hypothetical protein